METIWRLNFSDMATKGFGFCFRVLVSVVGIRVLSIVETRYGTMSGWLKKV